MQNLPDVQENLHKRLKKIEGQVKGIDRMIEEGKNCQDVLTQISAARSALKMVGNMVLNHYAEECLLNAVSANEQDEKVDELQKLIQTITRFAD